MFTILRSCKRYVTAFVFIFMSTALLGQAPDHIRFYISDSIQFKIDGKMVEEPFTGGFNLPVYSQCDINNDGKPDILVFDRIGNQFLTYINTGTNQSFSYEYAPQFEFIFNNIPATTYAMFRDFNRDGKPDLFTLENNRVRVYMNVTQNNDTYLKLRRMGDLYFRNTTDGPILFNILTGRTRDLPIFSDIDGDGDMDYITYDPVDANLKLFKNEQVEKGLSNDTFAFRLVDFCWGGFREAPNNEIVLSCNTVFYPRYYSHLPKDAKIYPDRTPNRRHEAGTTLLAIDLDNDGDVELIMGNGEFENLLTLYNGKSELGLAVDSMIGYKTYFPERGVGEVLYKNTPALYHFDVDGDGVKDMLSAPYYLDEYISTQNSYFLKNEGTDAFPDFRLKSKQFLTEKTIDFGNETGPVFWDIDNDGLVDLLLVVEPDKVLNPQDSFATIFRFNNVGTRENTIFELVDENFANIKSIELNNISLAIGDMNRDGKQDLLLGTQSGFIYYLRNTSPSSTTVNPTFDLQSTNLLAGSAGSYVHPAIFDYNRDGFPDIITGNSDGFFSYYQNNANPNMLSFTLITDKFGNARTNFLDTVNFTEPLYSTIGRSTPFFFDFDQDGKPELVSGSSTGQLKAWYISYNIGTAFPEITDLYGIINESKDTTLGIILGVNTKIAVTRFTDSGKAEVLVGNKRGGLKFLSARAAPPQRLSVRNITTNNFAFRVYPNPNKGSFSVEIPANHFTNNSHLQVVDFTGRIVFKQPMLEPQKEVLLHLQAGIYAVKIVENGAVIGVKKFIVQ